MGELEVCPRDLNYGSPSGGLLKIGLKLDKYVIVNAEVPAVPSCPIEPE